MNSHPGKVFLWAVVMLLSACATPGASSNRFPNVTVYGQNVQITDVSNHFLQAGDLQVVVFGRSSANYDRSVRYRALWADGEGRPIDTTVSAWRETSLPGLRPFTMEFVAPGERAKAYRIEIEVLGRY